MADLKRKRPEDDDDAEMQHERGEKRREIRASSPVERVNNRNQNSEENTDNGNESEQDEPRQRDQTKASKHSRRARHVQKTLERVNRERENMNHEQHAEQPQTLSRGKHVQWAENLVNQEPHTSRQGRDTPPQPGLLVPEPDSNHHQADTNNSTPSQRETSVVDWEEHKTTPQPEPGSSGSSKRQPESELERRAKKSKLEPEPISPGSKKRKSEPEAQSESGVPAKRSKPEQEPSNSTPTPDSREPDAESEPERPVEIRRHKHPLTKRVTERLIESQSKPEEAVKGLQPEPEPEPQQKPPTLKLRPELITPDQTPNKTPGPKPKPPALELRPELVTPAETSSKASGPQPKTPTLKLRPWLITPAKTPPRTSDPFPKPIDGDMGNCMSGCDASEPDDHEQARVTTKRSKTAEGKQSQQNFRSKNSQEPRQQEPSEAPARRELSEEGLDLALMRLQEVYMSICGTDPRNDEDVRVSLLRLMAEFMRCIPGLLEAEEKGICSDEVFKHPYEQMVLELFSLEEQSVIPGFELVLFLTEIRETRRTLTNLHRSERYAEQSPTLAYAEDRNGRREWYYEV